MKYQHSHASSSSSGSSIGNNDMSFGEYQQICSMLVLTKASLGKILSLSYPLIFLSSHPHILISSYPLISIYCDLNTHIFHVVLGKLQQNKLVKYRGLVQDIYDIEYFCTLFEERSLATNTSVI